MSSFEATAYTVCVKKLACKGLTKNSKSKKGHNSVKIQFRVMGLGIQGSLGVRKVAGSIPSRDIPKVVKRWYK